MTTQTNVRWPIWWIVWAAFQIGIFLVYSLLGAAAKPVPTAPSAMWMIGFVPVAVSAFIRWAVLPRVETAQAALPMFIVGLALAEMACFLGVFVFPAHRLELFSVSVAGIFQFIPVFAWRYIRSDEDEFRD